jgi:hypothetical protein
MLPFLAAHWFSLTLVLLAFAWLGVSLLRKRGLGWAWTGATALVAFAAGAGFLHARTYRLNETWPDQSVGFSVALGALILFTVLGGLLLLLRRWSFVFGCVCAAAVVVGLGGWFGRDLGQGTLDTCKSVVWTRFVSPWWLLLLLIVPAVYLISRKSLAGLGPVRRWVAIAARSLMLTCLILALAEPRVRRPSENMTVIFVVDRSASIPRELEDTQSGDVIDRRWNRIRQVIEQAVKTRYSINREDQFGVIFFGKRPKLAFPPTPLVPVPVDEQSGGKLDENYTDISSALKLAMATFPESTGKRIVLVSDGNQNLGSAEEQAEIARKNNIAIDTIALAPNFRNENEVLVQSVEAPPVSAIGARLPIRVLVRNSHPTKEVTGRMSLIRTGGELNGQAVDVDRDIAIEDSPQVLDTTKKPARVVLKPGLNVFKFRDDEQTRKDTSYTYKAKFDPDVAIAGDRVANNRADAAVVARGQRKILFLDSKIREEDSEHQRLLNLMRASKMQYVFRSASVLPGDKTELGVFLSNFDCLILANVPAENFSTDQMEAIRTQVYDQGCGLVMVGGPDSYGPGGYQQTPIEAALPVDCEIKAKKAVGKGGLILIMHASEMADGNKWQKIIAKLAIQRLGPADMVGVVDFGLFNAGQLVNWQIKFQEVGDNREAMYAAIDKMNPGDMPDFDPFLQVAADTLSSDKYELQVKHTILISDGDPNFGNKAALAKMAKNQITCTTIGVATHGVNEDKKMQLMAASTKDGKGNPGNFYKVTDPTKLPAIYVKESRKISQSFIYDKTFEPIRRTVGGPMAGLPNQLPSLHGFVRTTNKQSPTHEMHIEGPMDAESKQQFPVLSTWRYGLGKAAAFTSDGRDDTKAWSRDWNRQGIYDRFWENTINWAMREAERGKLSVVTRYTDGKVKIVVDARDEKDKSVPGLSLRGAVTPPSKPQPGDKVPTITFKPNKNGQYEAEFDAQEAGAYFVNVQADQEELDADGKVKRDPTTKRVVMKSFDAARAGVTVPYSPEFVDLESNTGLLKELSEKTGGQYFEEPNEITNPAELVRLAEFFRKGPEVIRSVLPFWFWLVFAAGLLLLLDVGARRISIETKEVRSWARRTWAMLRRSDAPVEEDDGGMLGKLGQRKAQVSDKLQKQKAKKFEADADTPAGAAPTGADDYADKTDGPPLLPPPPTKQAPSTTDDDDYMTRMKKARDRGRK